MGISLSAARASAILVVAAMTASMASASEPNAQRVSHFVGAAGESVPIQVPPFHGIEPRLSLSYSSEARNGFAGMGWNLTGISVIERGNGLYGYPTDEDTQIFTLDGQGVRPCPVASTYPSCAAGGTHYTHQESFLRIKKVSDVLWQVFGKDGTRTDFEPIYTELSLPTFRLGQTRVVDTHGNTVLYHWAVNAGGINGNTYPSSITYNGYTIDFFREARPDLQTRPGLTDVFRAGDRLKSVVVSRGTDKIRAYKLAYTTSATGKSLLASVQMYGRDVSVDQAGSISGGTALPAQTFSYQTDAAVASFTGDAQISSAGPPAANSSEPILWILRYNTITVGTGNTLQSLSDPGQYKYASGNRALASGTGHLEFTYTGGNSRYLYIGQYAAYIAPSGEIWLIANGAFVAGPYSVSIGQLVRLHVAPTGVVLIVNDVPKATHVVTTTYPMNVVGYIYGDNEQLSDVRISGSLVNAYSAACGAEPRHFGDFNGDGRTDAVCRNDEGTVAVTLATAGGFANPTIWGYSGEYISGTGDFNNDGKDDIVFFNAYWGETFVGLSTGANFGAITPWGSIAAHSPSWPYPMQACRFGGAAISRVADFNGDGRADLLCYIPTDPDRQFVAISQNTSFQTYVYSELDCPTYDPTDVDTNADGVADLICKSTNGDIRVLQAAGGFMNADVLTGFCSAAEFTFGDWNGDGTSDAACANNGRAALRTGQTFVDLGVSSTYCVAGQRLAADLDGDGAAEWICNNPGAPGNDIEVRRWNGLAFDAATTWRGGFCPGTINVADFNGDGKKDLLCASSGSVIYAGTKDMKSDLLTETTNGIGGSSSITWATSTQVAKNGGGGPSTSGLPAKYLVVATSADDGRTGSRTTSFLYHEGAQNDSERKFFGFQYVSEILPALAGESEGPVITRKFRTDAAAAGRLESMTRWSDNTATAKALFSVENEYMIGETGDPAARRIALLTGVWTYQYTGLTSPCSSWPCADGKRTKVEYSYDDYGNVGQIRNFGEVGAVNGSGAESPLSDDETTISTSYVPNTSLYIVGLPSYTATFSGIGTGGALLGETRFSRDGNTAWSQAPTKGDLTKTEVWLAEQSRHLASTASYDSYGNVISTTDATNKSVGVTYEGTLNLYPVSTTNGASETTTTTWDYLCGVPLTTTDPNGVVTTFATDPLCRPTTTTVSEGVGVVSTTSYVSLGNPEAQRSRVEAPGPDGSPSWSESFFDGFGRTYKTRTRGPSAAESIVTEVDFDARGHVWGQKAPYYENAPGSAAVTVFEYDWFDRPVKTILPDSKTRLTAYPALGSDGLFQVVSTNELGQSSVTKTNALGQVRKAERPTALHGNLVTTRNYDLLGRMTSLVDPVGNTWSYTFDSLGRNLTKADPDAGTWTYAYDDAGRVVSQQDAKAQTTTLEYDAAGRPRYKRLRPVGGPTGTITETVETVYGTSSAAFNVGRVAQLVRKNGAGLEQNGKLAFEYDALGRVKKQTRTIDSTDYVVERNYDAAGYLRGMRYPDNDILGEFGGLGTALGYDQAGRLSSIPGILSGVTYNALGAPLVQTNANGTTTTKTYDASRFWLTDIDTSAPSLTLQNLHYTLNDAGMATAVDSDVTNESWAYAYDELNRLTSSTNGVGANDQSWTYDAIGRFTANSRVGSTFTYPTVGNARPHAPSQISGGPLGLLAFAYDANGNMQSGNGRSMTWNPENMITQVVANSRTTTFTYGPDGDRIKKAEGSTVMRYPFGDDYEIATDGTVTKYFDAGFGPVAKKVGGTLYWLHTDRLGSINATTDDTGAQVLRRSFRSYGELLGQTGTHAESLGYIGQRTDEETANGTTDDKGLTYLHARYYDSALGIFLSPDPIGADRNTYRYSFGDSVNFRDPSGLQAAGFVCDEWGWTENNSSDSDFKTVIERVCTDFHYNNGGGGGSGGPEDGGGGGGGPVCTVDRWDPDCGPGGGGWDEPPCKSNDARPICNVVQPPGCEVLGGCPVKTCKELGACPPPDTPPGSTPSESPMDRSRPDSPLAAQNPPYGPPCESFGNRFASNFNAVSYVPSTRQVIVASGGAVFATTSLRLAMLGRVGAAALNMSIATPRLVVAGAVLAYNSGAAAGSFINATYHRMSCRS